MMRPSLPLFVFMVAGACRGVGTQSSEGVSRGGGQPDPRDYVGKDSLVDPSVLIFADPTERERFERARACLTERGREWEHYPLRKIGNFVEEDWCRGPRAELGCSGGGFRDEPGIDWPGVGTLHYS